MKIFWPVLAAILVAFAIIFVVKAFHDQNERTQSAFENLQAELAKPVPKTSNRTR